MLGSITPLGERGRGQSFPLTLVAFILGALAGGVTIGALLGSIGSWFFKAQGDWPSWVLLSLVALGLAFDLRLGGIRLPTPRRQVNEEWLGRYRGWVYGAGFGFQLGLGIVTIVSVSATYLVLAAAFLSGSGAWGLIIGGAFGFTRALMILPASRVRTTAELARLTRLIHRFDQPSRSLVLVAESAVLVVVLGIAVA